MNKKELTKLHDVALIAYYRLNQLCKNESVDQEEIQDVDRMIYNVVCVIDGNISHQLLHSISPPAMYNNLSRAELMLEMNATILKIYSLMKLLQKENRK